MLVADTRRAPFIPNDPNFFRSRPLRQFQMTKVTDSDSEVSVTMSRGPRSASSMVACSDPNMRPCCRATRRVPHPSPFCVQSLAQSGVHAIIASAAKQSRLSPRMQSGLLRCARNDDAGASNSVFKQQTCVGIPGACLARVPGKNQIPDRIGT